MASFIVEFYPKVAACDFYSCVCCGYFPIRLENFSDRGPFPRRADSGKEKVEQRSDELKCLSKEIDFSFMCAVVADVMIARRA